MDFHEHVGLSVDDSHDGTARVVLDATDQHMNAAGALHGGVTATLIDVAMGSAVASAGGEAPATVSLTVTYLEPGQAGELVATARVRKKGSRLILVEAEVQQAGATIADALGTFAVKS